ncbi:MAG TPA: hypothetical protein VGV06_04925 [Methylomirabilota bacterium]|nr:hypothetical protein [Methylomirabilota bacterium]
MQSKARSILRKVGFMFGIALAALPLVLAPAVAQAQRGFQTFDAHGPFVISLGKDIHAAGNSGRFVVPVRHVYGLLVGSPTSTNWLPFVPFVIEFATNVPIATQSGNVHGTLSICEAAVPTLLPPLFWCVEDTSINFSVPSGLDNPVFQPGAVTRQAHVALQTQIGVTPVLCSALNDPDVRCTAPDGFAIGLLVTGSFTFTGGTAQGHGDVNGYLVLQLDSAGHIIGIAMSNGGPASNVNFTGVWKP